MERLGKVGKKEERKNYETDGKKRKIVEEEKQE